MERSNIVISKKQQPSDCIKSGFIIISLLSWYEVFVFVKRKKLLELQLYHYFVS